MSLFRSVWFGCVFHKAGQHVYFEGHVPVDVSSGGFSRGKVGLNFER